MEYQQRGIRSGRGLAERCPCGGTYVMHSGRAPRRPDGVGMSVMLCNRCGKAYRPVVIK